MNVRLDPEREAATTHFRIGEFARRAGATPRLVRYYEERGLLPDSAREDGEHRLYGEADVERLRELLRVRDLLGLSLDELHEWTEAEVARAAIREQWHAGGSESPERKRLLADSAAHLDRQIALVRARTAALEHLEQELRVRRDRVLALRREPTSQATTDR